MKKFQLTPAALFSFKSIGYYTENEWGVAQRDKYLGELDTAFHKLAKSPKLGRLRNEIKTGIHSYQQGKHIIFYFIEPEQIVIVEILHESMKPSLHF